MTAPHYKAFISYSHRDEAWSRWLQHSLEKYRVPQRLVGQQGMFGVIPARLNPVFRDREDLSSASDLSTQIKSELERAETLVVICSPSAAASNWVNEEIRYFQQLGRPERILALIVDGDPQAKDPAQACFPAALLQAGEGARKEPMAANARKYADGKHLAFLKIVSGMLGVRLDELRRRDAQRRTRNRILYLLASVALITVVGWLTYSESTTRAAAQVQRTNTEELLSFMLGDLKRLSPIEGLETLPSNDEEQVRYRQELNFVALDNERLMQQALVWREEGAELQRTGDNAAAMTAYEKSRAAFIELHQREGSTARALFELGQTEFYIGEVHWYMGELDQTEAAWMRYGALTRRLVNAEPNNAAYVMELSYTLMNLGALEQSRADPDGSRSLQLIQTSLQYNQMALVLEPDNELYREERVTSLAWLSDAWLEKCELGNSLESRQQSVDLGRELVSLKPDQKEQQIQLAYMLTGLANVQQKVGLNDAATASFAESVEILGEVHRAEPFNAVSEWEWIYRSGLLGRHLHATGQVDAAWELSNRHFPRMNSLSQDGKAIDHLMAIEAALFRVEHARLQLERGLDKQGEALLHEATLDLAELVRQKPGLRAGLSGLVYAYFEFWEQFGSSTALKEIGILLAEYLTDPGKIESCSDANQAARLAVVNGDLELARRYTGYVLDKGYLEAGFVNFCKAYQLCDLP